MHLAILFPLHDNPNLAPLFKKGDPVKGQKLRDQRCILQHFRKIHVFRIIRENAFQRPAMQHRAALGVKTDKLGFRQVWAFIGLYCYSSRRFIHNLNARAWVEGWMEVSQAADDPVSGIGFLHATRSCCRGVAVNQETSERNQLTYHPKLKETQLSQYVGRKGELTIFRIGQDCENDSVSRLQFFHEIDIGRQDRGMGCGAGAHISPMSV
jgi:hypothetical protein